MRLGIALALKKDMVLRLRAFIFLILFTVSSAHATTVNMFAGKQLGGFGDIASNLIMAQKLIEARPDLTINFWVGNTKGEPNGEQAEVEKIKVLLPELDLSTGHHLLNGIHFFDGQKYKLPRADIFLAFSVKTVDNNQHLYSKDFKLPDELLQDRTANKTLEQIANAPIIVKYKEYLGANYSVADVYRPVIDQVQIDIETGAQAAGLYVTPYKAMQEPSRNYEQGFAYSTYAYATLVYLKSVMQLALKNPAKKYIVYSRNFPELKRFEDEFAKVTNLDIRRREKIDFATTGELIRASTLPILVTGDVSMSIAIQYAKPFLYELHRWKRGSLTALTQNLSAHVLKENESKALAGMVALPPKTLYQGTFNELPVHSDIFENAEFNDKITAGLKRLTVEKSLPAFTLHLIDSLSEVKTFKAGVVKEALVKGGVDMKPGLLTRLGRVIQSCVNLLTFQGSTVQ